MTIVAIATMLATASAFGQSAGPAGSGTHRSRAKPLAANAARGHHTSRARNTGQAAAASTPESRSAAALALSHEPTSTKGPRNGSGSGAELLGYCGAAALAGDTRRGQIRAWRQGPHDDLLRQRLLMSGDLAPDKTIRCLRRRRHRGREEFPVAPRAGGHGNDDAAHPRRAQRPVQQRIKQLEASLERLAIWIRLWPTLCGGEICPRRSPKRSKTTRWCGAIA